MAFLSGYITEATILWSSLYVADTLQGGPVLGGAAYTVTTAAGIAALLLVDHATHRFGAIRLFRTSTLLAATGLGICLTITSPLAAIIGFAILSAGTACVNPTVYTFAGNQRKLTASAGVSVVEIAQMPGGSIARAGADRCTQRARRPARRARVGRGRGAAARTAGRPCHSAHCRASSTTAASVGTVTSRPVSSANRRRRPRTVLRWQYSRAATCATEPVVV